jgi:hypothetical protein
MQFAYIREQILEKAMTEGDDQVDVLCESLPGVVRDAIELDMHRTSHATIMAMLSYTAYISKAIEPWAVNTAQGFAVGKTLDEVVEHMEKGIEEFTREFRIAIDQVRAMKEQYENGD